MTEQDYNALPGLRASHLVEYRRTPAHARFAMLGGRPETNALRRGTAAHILLLEPERFSSVYVIKPEGMSFATKEGKEWRKLQDGRDMLTATEHDEADGIARAAYNLPDPDWKQALLNGTREHTLEWTEPNGIRCKCRLDLFYDGTVYDLKSARDASPEGFARAVENFAYLVKAAHYLAGVRATGLHPDPRWVFCAVEPKPPHLAALYEVSRADMEEAETERQRLLTMHAACLASGTYPGYPVRSELVRPVWAGKDVVIEMDGEEEEAE